MYISHIASKIIYLLILILIFCLALHNIFANLSVFPIFSWDEARHGVNAYEMLKKGNFIVNTYNHQLDYWNLKPPLSFLLTMAGYKIAGFNTLGLRIFSAVSAFMTIIIIFLFVFKKHGITASIISALSLATSKQFLINHSARTADADSLFGFLFTFSILSILLSEREDKWLYCSGFTFSLAFLTKSWHAGNILVIIFLYLLFSGIYKRLTIKSWVLLFTCMFVPVFIWGFVRFQYDGIQFIKSMITYDLLKRSSAAIEGHIGSRFYYFENLWKYSKYWLLLLISLTFAYVCKSPAKLKSIFTPYTIGLCLWLFIPLMLYSIAETKIRWYILPVYPVLAIMVGILAAEVFQKARVAMKIALLGTLLLISGSYQQQISNYIHHPVQKFHLSLVQNIQGINKVKGYNLFVYRHTKDVWTQNTVLAAELYGDLKVKDGGLTAFLKNDKGLLLLKNNKKSKKLIKANNLVVITSNRWGYIVGKTK